MAKKKNSSSEFLEPVPPEMKWPRCPEAEKFILENLEVVLGLHIGAKRLSIRMKMETSTEFLAWVDHIVVPKQFLDRSPLFKSAGFVPYEGVKTAPEMTAYWHPFADLPKVLSSTKAKLPAAAISVESLWRFMQVHNLSLPIEGSPYSGYRQAEWVESGGLVYLVERRGSADFVPSNEPTSENYLKGFELWGTRPRRFESDEKGMADALDRAKKITKLVGPGSAAWIFLEGERAYWENRNAAGRIQKARQDLLGLGWANHDHHTFRSSRAQFPALIEILMAFGFKKRERFYAGAEAGWGAQVMEQPEAGLIIFADVDLAPEDVKIDFSSKKLPPLKKPGTVGLWCALHGESMLQAGMHHLEAQFDFDGLRESLQKNNIETMKPFSDFDHLRQAFTKGEMWPVDPLRLEKLKEDGAISAEAYEEIKKKGAVGSHLENLQRREGFKGFNQRGVSDIITEVNPERQALQ